METLEFDPMLFQNDVEADKQLLVRFFTKSSKHNQKSREAGRPIFRDREYIEIRFPGNRSDAVARPARDADKARFAAHYEAFKKRAAAPNEGTPLTEWPQVTRSQADELAFFNIKTVEQLAAVSDSHGSKFMGFNNLKQAAIKYMEGAKEREDAEHLKQELAARDEKLEQLAAQVAALTAAHDPAPAQDEIRVSADLRMTDLSGTEPAANDAEVVEEAPKPRKRRPSRTAKKE